MSEPLGGVRGRTDGIVERGREKKRRENSVFGRLFIVYGIIPTWFLYSCRRVGGHGRMRGRPNGFIKLAYQAYLSSPGGYVWN